MYNSDKVELKKNLNIFNCISLIVGIIIGSGIFISPKVIFLFIFICKHIQYILIWYKGVIQETGSIGLALIVWVVCGIFSMFGAIAYSGKF